MAFAIAAGSERLTAHLRAYQAGSPVGGPVRYWVTEPSTEQWPESNPDAALPYPLAGTPAAISGAFERGTPLVAADADDAAKLRALRAQYQATRPFTLAPQYSIPVVLSASNGSEYYDLSLRDTVPFEVDGALRHRSVHSVATRVRRKSRLFVEASSHGLEQRGRACKVGRHHVQPPA